MDGCVWAVSGIYFRPTKLPRNHLRTTVLLGLAKFFVIRTYSASLAQIAEHDATHFIRERLAQKFLRR